MCQLLICIPIFISFHVSVVDLYSNLYIVSCFSCWSLFQSLYRFMFQLLISIPIFISFHVSVVDLYSNLYILSCFSCWSVFQSLYPFMFQLLICIPIFISFHVSVVDLDSNLYNHSCVSCWSVFQSFFPFMIQVKRVIREGSTPRETGTQEEAETIGDHPVLSLVSATTKEKSNTGKRLQTDTISMAADGRERTDQPAQGRNTGGIDRRTALWINTEGGIDRRTAQGRNTEGGIDRRTAQGRNTEGGIDRRTAQGRNTEGGIDRRTAQGRNTEGGIDRRTAQGRNTEGGIDRRTALWRNTEGGIDRRTALWITIEGGIDRRTVLETNTGEADRKTVPRRNTGETDGKTEVNMAVAVLLVRRASLDEAGGRDLGRAVRDLGQMLVREKGVGGIDRHYSAFLCRAVNNFVVKRKDLNWFLMLNFFFFLVLSLKLAKPLNLMKERPVLCSLLCSLCVLEQASSKTDICSNFNGGLQVITELGTFQCFRAMVENSLHNIIIIW